MPTPYQAPKRTRLAPPSDQAVFGPVAFSETILGIEKSPGGFTQGQNWQMFGNKEWYCAERIGVPMSRIAVIFDGWGPAGSNSASGQSEEPPVIEFLLAMGTGNKRYEQMAFGKFDFSTPTGNGWLRTGLLLQVSGLLFSSWSMWFRLAESQPVGRSTKKADFVLDFLLDRVAGPCGADRTDIPLDYPNVDYTKGIATTFMPLPPEQ